MYGQLTSPLWSEIHRPLNIIFNLCSLNDRLDVIKKLVKLEDIKL